jgi:hypothetical protein
MGMRAILQFIRNVGTDGYLRVVLHHKSVIAEIRGKIRREVDGGDRKESPAIGRRKNLPRMPIHFENHLKGGKKPYSYELKTTKCERGPGNLEPVTERGSHVRDLYPLP